VGCRAGVTGKTTLNLQGSPRRTNLMKGHKIDHDSCSRGGGITREKKEKAKGKNKETEKLPQRPPLMGKKKVMGRQKGRE